MDAATNHFLHKWLKRITEKKNLVLLVISSYDFRGLNKKKSRTLKYLYGWNVHNKLKNMHLG